MPDRDTPGTSVPTKDAIAAPAVTGQLAVITPGPPPPVTPEPAKSRPWMWAVLVLAVGVAGGLWYFKPWASKGLAVTVQTVVPAPLVRVLAVNGRLAPLHLVELRPIVGGTVTAVLAAEGALVVQGDTLARIDASAQQALVRQALAGLDAGLVAQSQAVADLARAEALGENITRTALDAARSARQTADQEVARLSAAFDQAEIEVAKYTIRAPVAGTILTRNAEAGQAVDASTILFSLADLGQLVVETDVDETYATRIKVGLPAVLLLKGETAKRDGRVSFVAAQVDAATGGLAVKITLDKAVTAPVGLTVTANIIVDRLDAAIAMPRAAVVTDADGPAVFLAVGDQARRRAVTFVNWPADLVEVTDGLVPGDIVITDATGLSDGLAITVPAP